MGKTMKPDDFDQFVTDHGVCYTFKRSETDGKVSSPGKRTSGKKTQPETEKNSFAIIIKLKIDFNCRLVDIITVLSLKLSVLLVFKAKYKNKLPGIT